MKYCKACGKEIDDDCRYCSSCGTDQNNEAVTERVIYREVQKQDEKVGEGAIVLAILGFLIPFIGIIGAIAMFAGGKNKSAGIIGISTAIGFVFWLLFWGF